MFSKTTEYALRATILIAQKSSIENKIGIQAIAEDIDSPQMFTAKIMQMLTKGNKVVCSVRGPGGGFYMTESQKKLPIAAILHAVGDEDIFHRCVLGLHECSDKTPCPIHSEYRPIRKQITHLFQSKSIRDLALELNSKNILLNNILKKKPKAVK
ncbi:MAG: hypothetical protein OJF59_002728 [Cytophagales bacterium]|jgi:Rrf2 family protein|nr:Rrf2 family transcriptional regulator [Bacteroidota bacterium]MBS1981664.1 Rrf2 family transcriptional regulator [Bacteroidota bacterium]WHZ08974.1 MAG: hypothetical protein OJF59_002728 [Cytophagales bacterium]